MHTPTKLGQVIRDTIAKTPAYNLNMQLYLSVSRHITLEFAKALAVAGPETSAVLVNLHKALVNGPDEK